MSKIDYARLIAERSAHRASTCDAHVGVYGLWLWSAPECNQPGTPPQTRPAVPAALQLSEVIDLGLATLGWDAHPEDWRIASFEGLMAYVSPCVTAEIIGELFEEE